jgi:hypothetical protein
MARKLLIVFITIATLSCSEGPFDSASQRAEEEYNKWKSLGITSYSIYQQRLANFVGSEFVVKVSVANNTIIAITDTAGTLPIAQDNWKWYRTIDKLFELLLDIKRTKPNSYSVSYHDSLHFPTDLYISATAISSEAYNFHTEKLVPLK